MRAPAEGWQSGATAIEYALLVAAIASLIVIAVLVVGRQTLDGFCEGSGAMSAAGSTPNADCS